MDTFDKQEFQLLLRLEESIRAEANWEATDENIERVMDEQVLVLSMLNDVRSRRAEEAAHLRLYGSP